MPAQTSRQAASPRRRRLVPATLAVTVATLAALAFTAAPAGAADDPVRVNLNNVPSSITPPQPRNFSVRFENRTDQPIENVRTVITIELPGLTAAQVHVVRGFELQKNQSGPGQVTFTELFGQRLEPNRREPNARIYTLRFENGTPGGKANLTVTALSGGNPMGSSSRAITVRSGAGQPTPTPKATPSPTPTSPAATVPAPSQSNLPSIAPLGAGVGAGSSGPGSGVPVVLYVVGGVLVALGGAILWLLFRKPRGAAVAAAGYPTAYPVAPTAYPVASDYDTVRPSLGYPTMPRGQAGPAAGYPPPTPTAVYPSVPPTRPTPPRHPGPGGGPSVPPGVDPWAGNDPGTRSR